MNLRVEKRSTKDKRNGFTLLELLAVLVILAALSAIVIPIFANKGNEAKQAAHNTNMQMLKEQAQMYMLSHEVVADSPDIIDAMILEGYIKERPKYPINDFNTYAVEVSSGKITVKLFGPTAPTLVITADKPNITNATSITYTFTFSASVTGFDANDIDVTNGTKDTFAGSGAVYTMVVLNGGVGVTQIVSVANGKCTATLGGLANETNSKSIILAIVKTGNDLVVGNYIQFGSYLTKPIVWRVINKVDAAYLTANPGSGLHVGDLMLFSDKSISIKSFDSSGDNFITGAGGGGLRGGYGSNYWDQSNMKVWLNSTAGANLIDWLGCSLPVGINLEPANINEYDKEKGFLADGNFSATERGKIVPVTHKTILADTDSATAAVSGGGVSHTFSSTNASTAVANYATAYYRNTTESVFLLGIKELYDFVYNNTTLTDRATWILTYVTNDALTQSSSTDDPINDTTAFQYWLRDAYAAGQREERFVSSTGNIGGDNAKNSAYGVRPALFLSPTITLGQETGTTAATAYTIASFN